MCANYHPVTRLDRLLTFFGVERDPAQPTPPEVWPLGLAPFIRKAEGGSGNRLVDDGVFGLLPHFAKELAYGRKTYNARSETVHQLVSFRESWALGRRCIIPAEAIFEPCYESGKAVRWCIRQPGDVPMGIAGVYRAWRAPDGKVLWTFAMLTVNADGHPVFQRMHAPQDEKRMVVIVEPAEYDRWLQCSPDEARSFFRQWQGALDAFPAPLPPRGQRAAGPIGAEGASGHQPPAAA
jgi:putative SOS response-associated peptidase YedK